MAKKIIAREHPTCVQQRIFQIALPGGFDGVHRQPWGTASGMTLKAASALVPGKDTGNPKHTGESQHRAVDDPALPGAFYPGDDKDAKTGPPGPPSGRKDRQQ